MVLPVNISPFCLRMLLTGGRALCSWATSSLVRTVIDDTEQVFLPDLSLSCSIYYIYSAQITHPGTDLINDSMTHYIHVIHRFSIAHFSPCAVSAKHPTDPRWCGIYGAALRTMDSVRVHEARR